jgi:hypothetical protein
MTPEVVGVEWDEGNRDKCQKHGVSIEEIEALFRDPTASIQRLIPGLTAHDPWAQSRMPMDMMRQG